MSQRKSGLCVFLLAGAAAFGQALPEFEVASIKAATPPTMMGGAHVAIRIGMRLDQGRMEYNNGSLRDLIRTAYRVKDYQISGPDYLNDTRFDVVAKIPDGASTEQVPEMLQALLRDRFKLTLHHETKDHSVYALVAGKNGPKLKESDPNDQSLPPGMAPRKEGEGGPSKSVAAPVMGGMAGGRGGEGMMTFRMGSGGLQMNAKKITLPGFADMLSRYVDKPVVDMTGIEGKYDFAMDLSPESIMAMKGVGGGMMAVRVAGPDGGAHGPAEGASESTGVTVFQAVQQYGLKLDPRKAPLDTLVIDRVEKLPSEN